MLEKLILGTVQFGMPYGINNQTGQPDIESIFNILDEAFDSGIVTLDTSERYGDANVIIGKFHARSKKRFKIVSKFVLDSSRSIEQEIQNQIETLKVEYIDVLMFHKFDDLISNPDALNDLKQEKKKGRILSIGASVYTNAQIEHCLRLPDMNEIQVPYNLLDNHSRRGLYFDLAKRNGKILHARSVFLQGLFFMPFQSFPNNLLPLKKYLEQVHNIGTMANLSLRAMALQYTLRAATVDKVLFGVDSMDQLKQNLEALREVYPDWVSDRIDSIRVEESALLDPSNWK